MNLNIAGKGREIVPVSSHGLLNEVAKRVINASGLYHFLMQLTHIPIFIMNGKDDQDQAGG